MSQTPWPCVHVCVICGLAGIEAAHNERFWVQKLAKTATHVGLGTKIDVELRFRCPNKTALEARFGAVQGDIRRLSAHTHIGFESPLTTKRCSNGVGGRFQRLDSAPRHLLYMSGT